MDGPHGPIRLKWHMLRTRCAEAPFKPSNLALGWRLGASLEIDILAARRPALRRRCTTRRSAPPPPAAAGWPACRSRPWPGSCTATRRASPTRTRRCCRSPTSSRRSARCREAPGANLQLDLKLLEGRALADAAVADAAAAVAGLEHAIVVGSHHLDEARRLVAAMPGARLGYDPMRAASRDPGLARDPERLLRHIERRREGVALAYLRFDVVVAAEARGFPLVAPAARPRHRDRRLDGQPRPGG